MKIFTKRKGFAERKLSNFSASLHRQRRQNLKWRLDITRITYHFLWCVTPPQWFHTSSGYTVLFSVCGMKAREETKTVNLLSKKRHWKMERRRAAKANFSRSVVFGRRTEGERDTLHLPLHLSLSLPAPPPLSCLTPFTVFTSSSFPSFCSGLWEGRGRRLQAAQCSGGVKPLIGCHYPVALPTLILNLRVLCLAC